MFLRSAALSAALIAATVAATPLSTHLNVNAPGSAPTLQSLLAPGTSLRASLIAKLESAGGSTTDEYKPVPADFPAPLLSTIDAPPSPGGNAAGSPGGNAVGSPGGNAAGSPGGNAAAGQPGKAVQCTPEIRHLKGKLTSQGYMVIEGTCFGPSGNVLLNGFPNGNPQVTVQSWTPSAITVQFPKIAGVPDLVMHVAVTHGPPGPFGLTLDPTLKWIAAKFTAAIGDPVPLPSKYIAMNDCGGALPICLAAPPAMALGLHVDSAPASGADIWTLTIPDHWHLHAVRLVHLSPSAASSSTINGSGALKTIRVAWSESAIAQRADASSNCSAATINSLGAFEGPLMQQICAADPVVGVLYAANYRIEPMVRGPAGMTLP